MRRWEHAGEGRGSLVLATPHVHTRMPCARVFPKEKPWILCTRLTHTPCIGPCGTTHYASGRMPKTLPMIYSPTSLGGMGGANKCMVPFHPSLVVCPCTPHKPHPPTPPMGSRYCVLCVGLPVHSHTHIVTVKGQRAHVRARVWAVAWRGRGGWVVGGRVGWRWGGCGGLQRCDLACA